MGPHHKLNNIELQAICRSRRLSTKGTKRMLLARLQEDDRKEEEATRRAKLRRPKKEEFGGSGFEGMEIGQEGLTLSSSVSNKGSRARTSLLRQGMRGGRARSKGSGRNKYMGLAELDSGDGGDAWGGRDETVGVGALTQAPSAKTTQEGNIAMDVDQQNVDQRYNREIEQITIDMERLPLPTIHYCRETGQTMSLDNSTVVRREEAEVSSEEEEL